MAGLAGGLCAALLLGMLFYQRLDQQGQAERRASAARLQAAHDMLETQIAQRTTDLTAANAALQLRVSELQHAETILRGTRDAAVQAGKLAVLGQMAAGMSHELNQPLAALQTLSDNAVALDRQGRREDVAENLQLIGQLAARMGRIVRQLKSFVRKETPVLQPCRVRDALDHALLLLAQRCTAVQARIDVQPFDAGLRVMADPTRLEQVLVNLLRNGLDAVQDRPVREVRFAPASDDGWVRLRVSDTGAASRPRSAAGSSSRSSRPRRARGSGWGSRFRASSWKAWAAPSPWKTFPREAAPGSPSPLRSPGPTPESPPLQGPFCR